MQCAFSKMYVKCICLQSFKHATGSAPLVKNEFTLVRSIYGFAWILLQAHCLHQRKRSVQNGNIRTRILVSKISATSESDDIPKYAHIEKHTIVRSSNSTHNKAIREEGRTSHASTFLFDFVPKTQEFPSYEELTFAVVLVPIVP